MTDGFGDDFEGEEEGFFNPGDGVPPDEVGGGSAVAKEDAVG